MGDVISRECVTNKTYEHKHRQALSSLDWEWVQIWEDQKLTVGYMAVVSETMAELMEEDE